MQLLDEKRSRLLERGFWLALAALGAYEALTARYVTPEVTGLALLVCAVALLPGYLWLRRKVPGYPLFPMMAATYVWTYGLPALNQQPAVAAYPPARQAVALATALLFLTVSTLIWLVVVRAPAPAPERLMQFDRRATVPLLLTGMAVAAVYQLNGSLKLVPLGRGYGSIVTALAIATASVAAPTLAFLLGQGKLSRRAGRAYLAFLGVYVVTQLSTLYLSSAVTLALCVAAYSVGRGRVPFAFVAGMLAVFTVLHLGKGEMRARYWKGPHESVSPMAYPTLFRDWVEAGFRHALSSEEAPGERATQSPLERSSLLWVMLRIQEQIPSRKPYLEGETYAFIPAVLVPRVLNQSKMVSQRGNQILAVYTGMMREQEVIHFNIGFGLLVEAYANFGWAGVVGLAVLLGALLGQLTRWSSGAPVISFRGTFALLVLVACLQTETTAGLVVSALFQQSMVLVTLACTLMRPLPTAEAAAGGQGRERQAAVGPPPDGRASAALNGNAL
jgi:hypothetical protein